jgi:hypothetical protein
MMILKLSYRWRVVCHTIDALLHTAEQFWRRPAKRKAFYFSRSRAFHVSARMVYSAPATP